MNRIRFFAMSLILCGVCQSAHSQELTVIKGRVQIPPAYQSSLTLEEFPLTLFEQITFDPPPLPENWAELDVDAQNEWWSTFQSTPAGETFLSERQRKLDAAHRFPIRLEEGGAFIVYDVPPGVYVLSGRVDKELNGINHAFEVFGRLEILKETDELLMQAVEITVTPLLQHGDPAPQPELRQLDQSAFAWNALAGRPALLLFWSAESPPSTQFLTFLDEMVRDMAPDRKLAFLPIALDRDIEVVKEFLKDQSLSNKPLLAQGWDSDAARQFGVRSIPSIWLIDPQGKISLSNFEFNQAISLSQLELREVIQRQLDGEPIPNFPPPKTPLAADDETSKSEGENENAGGGG